MKRFHLTAWGSLLSCCLSFFINGYGQGPGLQIHGSVKAAADNTALGGVTVALASDRKIATSTDGSGNFVLNIPAGAAKATIRLVISSIGFQTREVSVLPGQTEVPVLLEAGHAALNEVVVTALGIDRQKKITRLFGYHREGG